MSKDPFSVPPRRKSRRYILERIMCLCLSLVILSLFSIPRLYHFGKGGGT